MKRKVMFFINTLAGGGAEKVLVNLLKVLDYEKYDITLFILSGGDNLKAVPPQVHVKQIVKGTNWLSGLYTKAIQKIPRRWFAQLFLRGDFDIEIAYLPGFPTRVLAAKPSKPGVKKYAFVHGTIDESTFKVVNYSNVEECRREYFGFDKVCFVSEQARQCLEGCIGQMDNAEVVYNVVNCKEIEEKAQESTDISYTTNGTKFIAVGRLVAVKGFNRLLQAVKALKKKKYDFELWILGQGQMRDELSAYIKENQLDNVRLLGYHDNPCKYVKQADCFVCSSYTEGYSTAAIEALLVGTPVLTTDCAGMKEILGENEYGLIVDNSEQGIQDGLELFITDTDMAQRLGSKAKEYRKNSNIDSALKKYEELLDA